MRRQVGRRLGVGPVARCDRAKSCVYCEPVSAELPNVSATARPTDFAADLDDRLDKAIAERRIWNIDGLVVLRNERLVTGRYFEGLPLIGLRVETE
jgi:hypothetical protein